ncbi:MAG TPA: N-acetylmuramic acid 6-phosphate etherase [Thermoanaerobaculia bacterium]|nr:N-acetylmuramic acid 6-phosphate etherase [Thermoanaerobaculia bacterium]
MSQQRLAASLEIDLASAEEIVSIIQDQDETIAKAMRSQAANIARAIEAVADRMRNGGKLVYAGAGTSGRIAMLDASELPPTYGVDASIAQVLMAGGTNAFFSAAEGAEDNEEAGIEAVNANVSPEDSLVGIAASGSTPFTVAAVRRANMIGALTIGVTSTPGTPLARDPDIPIVVETGPEVIFGSTRMKAGTAQKLVLNTISTGVMIQLGRVYSNLMIEMPATNAKLRSRSVSMVEIASGATRPVASQALEASGGSMKEAVIMARLGVDAEAARKMLASSGGNLRKVLSD